MTVAELIEYLKDQPQDLQITYDCFSERCLLEATDIRLIEAALPRNDGWVHDKRTDKPFQSYLAFPGN